MNHDYYVMLRDSTNCWFMTDTIWHSKNDAMAELNYRLENDMSLREGTISISKDGSYPLPVYTITRS